MERDDIERLSKMEEKVDNVCHTVDNIDKKLDVFVSILNSKVDRDELTEIEQKVDNIKSKFLAVAGTFIVTLLGIIGALIMFIFQNILRWI